MRVANMLRSPGSPTTGALSPVKRGGEAAAIILAGKPRVRGVKRRGGPAAPGRNTARTKVMSPGRIVRSLGRLSSAPLIEPPSAKNQFRPAIVIQTQAPNRMKPTAAAQHRNGIATRLAASPTGTSKKPPRFLLLSGARNKDFSRTDKAAISALQRKENAGTRNAALKTVSCRKS